MNFVSVCLFYTKESSYLLKFACVHVSLKAKQLPHLLLTFPGKLHSHPKFIAVSHQFLPHPQCQMGHISSRSGPAA